ncbi:hypothetical protein [Leekyejoonella antrihumi]|nr:hypothetical protein [Leekyejoonella antrihumi]
MTALSVATGTFTIHPWWLAVGALFWVERVVTARHSTRTGVLLAALFVPELLYDAFLQVAVIRALSKSLRRADADWRHVTAPSLS